jgi:hypothetical protein
VAALLVLSVIAILQMLTAVTHDPLTELLDVDSSGEKLATYWGTSRWFAALISVLLMPSLIPLEVQRWWDLRREV